MLFAVTLCHLGLKAHAILMQAVDLTGEREFLTSETAETALAAMLAPGSTISQVCVPDGQR